MLCQVEFLRGAKFEADDRQVAIDVLRGDSQSAIDFEFRSFFRWIFAFLVSCKNGVLRVTYI